MSLNFHPFPKLSTDRLILRKPITEDLDSIFFLRSDSEVMRYINQPNAQSMREIEIFLKRIQFEIEENEILFWAITTKPNPEMIGIITLWNFSKDQKTAEMGYSLKPKFQQQGIMSEAVQAVLTFGFEALGFQTIEALTNWRNAPSRTMLLRNGFSLLEERTDPEEPENIVFGINRLEFLSE